MASRPISTKQLNLLLIGKTATGKSATGNSILMRKDAFKSTPGTLSVTKTASYELSNFNEYMIKVVDLPGIGDTYESAEKSFKMITTAAEEALRLSPEGYHAVLLVLKYGNRYTKEENESIEGLMNIFGYRIIIDRGIIVMTNGDHFKEDGIDQEEFVERERNYNVEFNKIVALCNSRFIVFNNKLYPKESDSPDIKTTKLKSSKEQIQNLINVILDNNLHLKTYTSEKFNYAKKERDRYLISIKEPRIREDMEASASKLLKTLELARLFDFDKRKKALDEASEEKETLEQKVKEEAKGTDALIKVQHIVTELGHRIHSEEMLFQREVESQEKEKQIDEALNDVQRLETELKRSNELLTNTQSSLEETKNDLEKLNKQKKKLDERVKELEENKNSSSKDLENMCNDWVVVREFDNGRE